MFKKCVTKLFDFAGYTLQKKNISQIDSDIQADINFIKIYNECKNFTMVSVEKSYALYKATQYIVQNGIQGDFVECGVWKGGQAMLVAKTLIQEGDTSRSIFLFDTFSGMSEPSKQDFHIADGSAAGDIWESKKTDSHNEWCYAPLEEVKKNLSQTKYPENKIFYEKGMVEESIPRALPLSIAILRLDTDWYESTSHELLHAYPRLVQGGVLIVDDYGTWAGSRKATDEYFSLNKAPVLLCKIGKSGRIALKMQV